MAFIANPALVSINALLYILFQRFANLNTHTKIYFFTTILMQKMQIVIFSFYFGEEGKGSGLSGIVLSCEYKREWRQIQINVRQYEYMAELQTMQSCHLVCHVNFQKELKYHSGYKKRSLADDVALSRFFTFDDITENFF